jgi:anion-transporting  ArsA/GET3 family ATPase
MIGTNSGGRLEDDDESSLTSGGKWEDEEERRFFEDIQDLKDFVPKSVLGLDEGEDKAVSSAVNKSPEELAKAEKERVESDLKKLEEELAGLEDNGSIRPEKEDDEDYEYVICVRICTIRNFVTVSPRLHPALQRLIQLPVRKWLLRALLSSLLHSWLGFRMRQIVH